MTVSRPQSAFLCIELDPPKFSVEPCQRRYMRHAILSWMIAGTIHAARYGERNPFRGTGDKAPASSGKQR